MGSNAADAPSVAPTDTMVCYEAAPLAIVTDTVWPRATMPTETVPVEAWSPDESEVVDPDTPWIVLVWNDPINLMSYVTFVFQKLFGYSREKAEKLMMDVHVLGRAVVSSGSREKAERDVFRLHEHGLWATMQQDA